MYDLFNTVVRCVDYLFNSDMSDRPARVLGLISYLGQVAYYYLLIASYGRARSETECAKTYKKQYKRPSRGLALSILRGLTGEHNKTY